MAEVTQKCDGEHGFSEAYAREKAAGKGAGGCDVRPLGEQRLIPSRIVFCETFEYR